MISSEVKTWLNAHPESGHPFDRERWYNVIIESIKTNQPIDFVEIEQYITSNKEWNLDFVKQFIENKEREYFIITEFVEFYDKK